MIPSGFGQANLRFSGPAAPAGAEVTFGFDNNTSELDAVDIAQLIVVNWTQTVGQQQTNKVNFGSCLVKLGPDESGEAGEAPGPGFMFVAGEALPPNVAVLLNKRTALGGRKGRGRMFVPGMAETLVDSSGILQEPLLTPLTANALLFGTQMADDGLPLVLLHNDATPPTPITSLIPSSKVATMRKRLRR